jgi:hypothetical protein
VQEKLRLAQRSSDLMDQKLQVRQSCDFHIRKLLSDISVMPSGVDTRLNYIVELVRIKNDRYTQYLFIQFWSLRPLID